MVGTKNSVFFKIAALIVLTSFLGLDIAWAYPEKATPKNYQTLAVPDLLQSTPLDSGMAACQQSFFSDYSSLATVCNVASYILKDELPLKYLEDVMLYELDSIPAGLDLSGVVVDNGVVSIPYAIEGKNYDVHIELSHGGRNDSELEEPSVSIGGYTVKAMPRDGRHIPDGDRRREQLTPGAAREPQAREVAHEMTDETPADEPHGEDVARKLSAPTGRQVFATALGLFILISVFTAVAFFTVYDPVITSVLTMMIVAAASGIVFGARGLLVRLKYLEEEASLAALMKMPDEELLQEYLDDQQLRYELDPSDASYLDGKVVVLFGAGGTIGAEMTRQLLCEKPRAIVLVDNHENSLFNLRRELKETYGIEGPHVVTILADIRNKKKVESIIREHRPNIVFHYANYKSLVMGNTAAGEFADLNIGGTKILLDAACSSPDLERFIYISSDKAQSPSQNYGRTKRINELMVQVYARKYEKIKFGSMRYCNVLDAAGCFVLSTFRDQIIHNNPITLRRMDDGEIPSRYYIPLALAARLAIIAGARCDRGEMFSMDKSRISAIAIDDLVRVLARKLGVKDVEGWFGRRVRIVGAARGEKKSEQLGMGEPEPGTPLIRIPVEKEIDAQWLLDGIDDVLRLAKDITHEQDVEELMKRIVDQQQTAEDGSRNIDREPASFAGTIDAPVSHIGPRVNNGRTEFIQAAQAVVAAGRFADEGRSDDGAFAAVNKTLSTDEIARRVRSAVAILESLPQDGVSAETRVSIDTVKKDLRQFEAEGAIAALIVLARRAKKQGQKLLFGLEIDWIPGIDVRGSYQASAIAALKAEITSIGSALRSMGLDIEIIPGHKDELAGLLLSRAQKTKTSLRNVVVMASKDTIESGDFKTFREASEDDRPFIARIDANDLRALYNKCGEDSSRQLYVRLAQMFYITLELAAGKEKTSFYRAGTPDLPVAISYDKETRAVIFLPSAESKDYEVIRNNYMGEKKALSNA